MTFALHGPLWVPVNGFYSKKGVWCSVSFVLLSLILWVTPICAGLSIGAIDQVCLQEGPCFDVSLVQTEAERAQGLMYRPSLAPREGMLFIFDREAIYPFWMKDTLVSLDILWLSSAKRVVHIETHTLPMSTRRLVPSQKALYVLEVAAGTVEKLNVRPGDALVFQSKKTIK